MRRNAASVLVQRQEHLVAIDDLRAAELLPQACLRGLANAGSANEHHATLPRHLHQGGMDEHGARAPRHMRVQRRQKQLHDALFARLDHQRGGIGIIPVRHHEVSRTGMYAEHVLHRVIRCHTADIKLRVPLCQAHPAHIGICLVFCGNLKTGKQAAETAACNPNVLSRNSEHLCHHCVTLPILITSDQTALSYSPAA